MAFFRISRFWICIGIFSSCRVFELVRFSFRLRAFVLGFVCFRNGLEVCFFVGLFVAWRGRLFGRVVWGTVGLGSVFLYTCFYVYL